MHPRALLSWFASHARALPWRDAPAGQRDAYRTWVSEVMLQQTRVETVLGYYEPFLRRFPDVRALASTDEGALMKAWEGLGYYRRARLMQRAARAMPRGELPRTYADLVELPGFGTYTAGAVASLAYNEAVPAVDGNVLRVFARQTNYDEEISTPTAQRVATRWVLRHQPSGFAGEFNEALMELGATVCTPRAPRCDACPVAASCAAPGEGLPVKARKAPSPTVRIALALARRGDALLLERRDSGLLAGTWGLPWVEVADGVDARALLAAHVGRLVGAEVQVSPSPARRGRHVFTHRRWEMEAYVVSTSGARGDWRDPREVALGAAHRKLLSTRP